MLQKYFIAMIQMKKEKNFFFNQNEKKNVKLAKMNKFMNDRVNELMENK